MSQMGEFLDPVPLPVHEAASYIFKQASDLGSTIRINREADWEVIKGTQPNGSSIAIARPILGEGGLNKEDHFVFQISIRYAVIKADEKISVPNGLERVYLTEDLGNVRLVIDNGDTVKVGPGELEDLATNIYLSTYS